MIVVPGCLRRRRYTSHTHLTRPFAECPHDLDYSLDAGVFHLHLRGKYTPADIRSVLERAFADPRFAEGTRFLMDVTRSESLGERSIHEVRDMASYLAQNGDRFGRRIGIAAASELHYGMMRMASVYAESGDLEVSVFHTVPDALAWLGRPDRASSEPGNQV